MRSLVLALILVPSVAVAVDPECVGLVGPVPTYAACELTIGSPHTLRFCTPQVDIDGDVLPAGAIMSCTITIDGVAETVAVADPGTVISIEAIGKNSGHTISAYCTSADGTNGTEWTSDVCFPTRPPARPRLIAWLFAAFCRPGWG